MTRLTEGLCTYSDQKIMFWNQQAVSIYNPWNSLMFFFSVEKTAETFLAYWVVAMMETDEVMLVQFSA